MPNVEPGVRLSENAGNYPGVGKYTYNLKLWDATLISRIDAFLAALAAHVDNHPNFNHISTTESSLGEPVIPFAAGESAALQFAGQIAVIHSMKQHFVHSMVIPDLNYDRDHVANMAAILENEGIGLGSSNSYQNWGITRPTPITAPGVLTYYPGFSGKIALAPEIQGADYDSTCGGSSVDDHPSYLTLYNRVRNDLKANYVVMQRNFPYWLGNSTTPSMLQFIKTHPAILDDATGAGGLNAALPASISGIPKPPGPVDPLPPSVCAP